MGTRRWASKLDMYKKVPGDLVEGTQEGRIISWIAVLLIVTLFIKETSEYWSPKLVSELVLDRREFDRTTTAADADQDDMIRVSFNITMMDLKCDYVEVDAVSVLGNNQNVTKFVTKHPIDGDGVIAAYSTRNKKQKDVRSMLEQNFQQQQGNLEMKDSAVTKSIEELTHENNGGESAISLDESTLGFATRENELVFVDFYASWCSHCRELAPTWEVLAKVMEDAAEKIELQQEQKQAEEQKQDILQVDEIPKEGFDLDVPVFIGKVDCVVHRGLCQQQGIQAYPTLRLFFQKAQIATDYHGHRNVMDMSNWLMMAEKELERDHLLTPQILNPSLERHLNMTGEEKHWAESLQRTKHHHQQSNDGSWNPKNHPGCQLTGTLLLNRVPGNFGIQAYSPYHDLVPHMTNVSHEIHHLSIMPSENSRQRKKRKQQLLLPPNFVQNNHPMDGNVYVTENLHEAYHHYIKLISVNGDTYQIMQSTQLSEYRSDQVPEAKFILDFSPIAVHYHMKQRPLYDYVSSLLAIIGGTFTVVGLVESAIRATARKIASSKRRQSTKQMLQSEQQQKQQHHQNGHGTTTRKYINK